VKELGGVAYHALPSVTDVNAWSNTSISDRNCSDLSHSKATHMNSYIEVHLFYGPSLYFINFVVHFSTLRGLHHEAPNGWKIRKSGIYSLGLCLDATEKSHEKTSARITDVYSALRTGRAMPPPYKKIHGTHSSQRLSEPQSLSAADDLIGIELSTCSMSPQPTVLLPAHTSSVGVQAKNIVPNEHTRTKSKRLGISELGGRG
jgi:hypothetical protein